VARGGTLSRPNRLSTQRREEARPVCSWTYTPTRRRCGARPMHRTRTTCGPTSTGWRASTRGGSSACSGRGRGRPHAGNAYTAELVGRYPDRLIGYCTTHPGYTRQALAELELRLVQQSDRFAALKLHSFVLCDDPLLDPLMELCAAHGVPVLHHTWKKVGPEGPGSGNEPTESTPERLVALARRHPRVKFFGGHGGGDWEWGVAAFQQVDNIWLDMGGGEAIYGFMDLALRTLGAGRIVFGTDIWGRSIPSQVSRVVACDLPPADLEAILWRNAAGVLGDRLPAAWRERFGS
jgi:predicted TIM-barrel fold metal-dependent hydrolase